MNIARQRWIVGAVGLLSVMGLCACLVAGRGRDDGTVYVGGYYEPSGREHGGWGPGYHVAPPRGGERRPETQHVYRPAPPSHKIPTIPTRPHRD